jgi:hypothetical protein
MRELPIPSQFAWLPMEFVNAIGSYVGQQETILRQGPCRVLSVLTSSLTSSQVSSVYWSSGVAMMPLSFSLQSFRNAGHSAGHWSCGTLTSQNGRGSSCGIPTDLAVFPSLQEPRHALQPRGRGDYCRGTQRLRQGCARIRTREPILRKPGTPAPAADGTESCFAFSVSFWSVCRRRQMGSWKLAKQPQHEPTS